MRAPHKTKRKGRMATYQEEGRLSGELDRERLWYCDEELREPE